YPAELFAPGVIPKGMDVGTKFEPSREFNRWQNYRPDTSIPLHRVSFNGLVDVPFGKGRHFLRNSNRVLDALIGGYQIAFVARWSRRHSKSAPATMAQPARSSSTRTAFRS